MLELIQPYLVTIWCFVGLGALLLLQLLVADLVGLANGHVPGSTVPESHNNFHFRATRAHANTNESLCAYLLLALAGIFLSTTSQWLNLLSLAYLGARVAHMLCYWFGWKILRSLSFMVSLGSLFGLLIVVVVG